MRGRFWGNSGWLQAGRAVLGAAFEVIGRPEPGPEFQERGTASGRIGKPAALCDIPSAPGRIALMDEPAALPADFLVQPCLNFTSRHALRRERL